VVTTNAITTLTHDQLVLLQEWTGLPGQQFYVHYSAERDGWEADVFRQKCATDIGPNVVLFRTTTGAVFGGYTSLDWSKTGAVNGYKYVQPGRCVAAPKQEGFFS